MIIGTLAAGLLRKNLTAKSVKRNDEGIIRAGEGF